MPVMNGKVTRMAESTLSSGQGGKRGLCVWVWVFARCTRNAGAIKTLKSPF